LLLLINNLGEYFFRILCVQGRRENHCGGEGQKAMAQTGLLQTDLSLMCGSAAKLTAAHAD
jgi:hypothetical protein